MTLTLSPAERRTLAARLDLNPWTLTPERVVERIDELKTRSFDKVSGLRHGRRAGHARGRRRRLDGRGS